MVAAEFSVPRMYETRVHVHRIGGCPNDVHRIGKADRLKSIMPGRIERGYLGHCPTGSEYGTSSLSVRLVAVCRFRVGPKRYLNMCNE